MLILSLRNNLDELGDKKIMKQNISHSKNKNAFRPLLLIMLSLMVMFLSACGSSEPCTSCGDTPTKAYQNNYTEEKEYYCESCSSDCAFCSDDASNHYTSGLGIIIFACDDCYEEIQEMNS